MKKVINGKMFSTETAKCVGEWDNGYFNSFKYCEEDLYRKENGEFFLYGRGGANSKYAIRCDSNSWCGGKDIIVLSLQSAMEWAEEHLSGDQYEGIFGQVPEDDSKRIIGITITDEYHEKAKRLAKERGISISELISNLIMMEL